MIKVKFRAVIYHIQDTVPFKSMNLTFVHFIMSKHRVGFALFGILIEDSTKYREYLSNEKRNATCLSFIFGNQKSRMSCICTEPL